jgi:hypothetical protein
VVFALIGALLLVLALGLGILGSFAFIAIASVGMFFIAAALIAQSLRSRGGRPPAVLAVAALGLILFGMVAAPLSNLAWVYLGWGLLAGAVMLALVNGRRASARRQT